MQDVADENGYSLVLYDGRHDPHVQRAGIELFLTVRVDAVILGLTYSCTDLLEPLVDASVPIEPVELLQRARSDSAMHVGTLAAFNRLFSLGHQSVAVFVRHRADVQSRSAEMSAWLRVVKTSRDLVAPNARIRTASIHTAGECVRELGALMNSSDPLSMLVAGNELMTASLLKASSACGLSIPEDVSVLAYGDSPWQPVQLGWLRAALDALEQRVRAGHEALARRPQALVALALLERRCQEAAGSGEHEDDA